MREEEERQDAKTPRREPGLEAETIARMVFDAAIEVHRSLGPGFPELVYENALCIELYARRIAFERQVAIDVVYKGHVVGEGRIDLVVGRRVVVELKSVQAIAPVHRAQTIAYLKATRLEVALLINFNTSLLRHGLHRFVQTPP